MDMNQHRPWNEWANLELDGAQTLCKKLNIKLPTQRDISKAGVINIKLPSGASLHMFRHGPHFWYYVLSGVAVTIDKPTTYNTDVVPYLYHNLNKL